MGENGENKESASFHNHLGNVCLSEGDFEKAKQHFNQALRLDNQYAEAYNNLGRLYYKQNLFVEAEPYFEKALRIDPNYCEAHYNLANNAVNQNQPIKAIEHYQEALRLKPNYANAELNLGLLQFEQENYEEAKIHLTKAIEGGPENSDSDNVNAVYYLANTLLNLGEVDEPIRLFEKTIELSPDFAAAHHNLAVLYLRKEDNAKALSAFEATLALQPDNQTAEHMVHALRGEQQEKKAPNQYVADLFDQYASYYDQHIKESLHYEVPGILRSAFATILKDKKGAGRILDLGCGTGLCGVYFRDMARELIGVDLSPKMIEEAKRRGAYDDLVIEDLLDYLKDVNVTTEPFDIIISGDVFVYFGDLELTFKRVAHALVPGGYFGFTTESLDALDEAADDAKATSGDLASQNYRLNPTGRFSHASAYIKNTLKQAGFEVILAEKITPRENLGHKVVGDLYIARV